MALDLTNLTPAEARELAKMLQQSHLQAVQDEIDKNEGQALHEAKNAPWAPGGLYEKALKEIPPYSYLEYPKMLYSADYVAACEELRVALRYRERKDEPG